MIHIEKGKIDITGKTMEVQLEVVGALASLYADMVRRTGLDREEVKNFFFGLIERAIVHADELMDSGAE